MSTVFMVLHARVSLISAYLFRVCILKNFRRNGESSSLTSLGRQFHAACSACENMKILQTNAVDAMTKLSAECL